MKVSFRAGTRAAGKGLLILIVLVLLILFLTRTVDTRTFEVDQKPSSSSSAIPCGLRGWPPQKELERYLAHGLGRKPTGSLYAPTMHRR